MKKLFTQTSVFILFLFAIPFVGMAQVATAGDFRTIVATGNWSDLTSWEARDAGGNWATPSAFRLLQVTYTYKAGIPLP